MENIIEKKSKEAKKQGYPSYYDGDLLCNICGEPWDSWYVRHEMDIKEAERFRRGKGCPACK